MESLSIQLRSEFLVRIAAHATAHQIPFLPTRPPAAELALLSTQLQIKGSGNQVDHEAGGLNGRSNMKTEIAPLGTLGTRNRAVCGGGHRAGGQAQVPAPLPHKAQQLAK